MQIERGKVQIERGKVQIECGKVQIERGILCEEQQYIKEQVGEDVKKKVDDNCQAMFRCKWGSSLS